MLPERDGEKERREEREGVLSEDVKHPQLPLASPHVNSLLLQMQFAEQCGLSGHSAPSDSFVMI